MNIFKYTTTLAFALFFISCQGNNSTKETVSEANTVDATEVKKAALDIDNLTVKVDQNTFETTTKMYNDLNKSLVAFEQINQSIANRMNEEMKLLTVLAKPFAFADNYSNLFSLNENYTATTPAFTINETLTNKYFLVSSTSKFFLEGRTIKTYFDDDTTLGTAWTRMISNADTSKDLYITIIELDSSNILNQVSNAFVIKKATLETL
jgi:hypothetical protein